MTGKNSIRMESKKNLSQTKRIQLKKLGPNLKD
jgi:hypothetical protein